MANMYQTRAERLEAFIAEQKSHKMPDGSPIGMTKDTELMLRVGFQYGYEDGYYDGCDVAEQATVNQLREGLRLSPWNGYKGNTA